jgi:prepilin-type N-terminal cleavage/methylation domain-containing protein
MKIVRPFGAIKNRRAGRAGFTLIEVVLSAAIAALLLAGMFQGYNMAGRNAQYAACSMAANASAMQQLEQITSTDWVPSAGKLQLFSPSLTNSQTVHLCLPSAQGNVVAGTNLTTVTQVSTNPPYVMIQVQCVWTFPSYGGTYTNTVAMLRAPNE